MTTPTNPLLAKLRGIQKATSENRKVPMTDDYVAMLKAKLQNDNRLNVYPNKFDMKLPFRVQTYFNSKGQETEWTTHGYFTDVDVASAVGTIASLAQFGEKAIAGEFDEAKVAKHPEYLAWMEKDINQTVIAKANAVG